MADPAKKRKRVRTSDLRGLVWANNTAIPKIQSAIENMNNGKFFKAKELLSEAEHVLIEATHTAEAILP